MTQLRRWDNDALISEYDGDTLATLEDCARRGIDCYRARLDRASLVGASLDGARLVGASLDGASLDGDSLPIWCRWTVTYTDTPDLIVHIGCKSMSIPAWDAWFAGADEFDTPRDDERFLRIHANYLAVRAYLVAMGMHTEATP